MKKGDIIICRGDRGYDLTAGKEYVVIDFEPSDADTDIGFTWPAYVHIIDDTGKQVAAHAARFVEKGAQ